MKMKMKIFKSPLPRILLSVSVSVSVLLLLLLSSIHNSDVIANTDTTSLAANNILYTEYKNLNKINDDITLFDQSSLINAIKGGTIHIEKVPAGKMIEFMFNVGKVNSLLRLFFNNKIVTKIYGSYNDLEICTESKLAFIRDILNFDLDIKQGIPAKLDAEFQLKYGKTIDQFKTRNEIFARKYTNEEVSRILQNFSVKENQVISCATSRTRIKENIDINKNVSLINKTIGGQANKFNVWRLFGQVENIDTEGTEGRENKNQSNVQSILNARNEINILKSKLEMVESNENRQPIIDNMKKITDTVILRSLALLQQGSTMVVHRLAPVDYHHIHFPFSKGKILSRKEASEKIQQKLKSNPNISKEFTECYQDIINNLQVIDKNNTKKNSQAQIHLDGSYLSVNPHATNSEALTYNPLTENVRDVLIMDTPVGIVPMVIIGAAGVGKNVINLEADQELKMGDNLAHFEFGGSSVVMFLPKDSVVPLKETAKAMKLKYSVPDRLNEKRHLETYVEMGQPLFKIQDSLSLQNTK
ncbi:MAG: phosphatidylserine decarboxylase [Oligoflexia bacterium]|nr:phosphatidylserine decarboxylase [Oligoflexia bacterium]